MIIELVDDFLSENLYTFCKCCINPHNELAASHDKREGTQEVSSMPSQDLQVFEPSATISKVSIQRCGS